MKKAIALCSAVIYLCATLVGCAGSGPAENKNESANAATIESVIQTTETKSSDTQDSDNETTQAAGEESDDNPSMDHSTSDSLQSEEQPVVLAGYRVHEVEEGWIYFDVIVQNVTESVINNVSVNTNVLDKDGGIVDVAYAGETVRVLPGQMIYLEGLTEADKGSVITADSFSFLDSSNNMYTGNFKDPETITLSKPDSVFYIPPSEVPGSAINEKLTMTDGDDDILVTDLTVGETDEQYTYLNVKLVNNTQDQLTEIGANIDVLDEYGNIIDVAYAMESTRVSPNQSIVVEGICDNSISEKEYFTVDSYRYSVAEEYIEKYVKEIPKAVEISPGNNQNSGENNETSVPESSGNDVVDSEDVTVNEDTQSDTTTPKASEDNGTKEETADIIPMKSPESDSLKQDAPADSDDKESSEHSLSDAEKYYNKVSSLKVSDLEKVHFLSKYDYLYNNDENMPLLPEDREWIENPMNKNGTVEAGAIYRKLAFVLSGIDAGIANYRNFSNYIIGYTPDSREEFVELIPNLRSFISTEDVLGNIMTKFDSLDSISGSFDIEYNEAGEFDNRASNFDAEISDVSECADELQISEEMLGYILGVLKDYGTTVTFSGNKCTIRRNAY